MEERFDNINNTEEQIQSAQPAAYAAQPAQAKKEKKSFRVVMTKICSVILAAVLFGGVAGAAFYGVSTMLGTLPGGSDDTAAGQTNASPESGIIKQVSVDIPQVEEATAQVIDVSDVAKNAMPSMVSITNVSVAEIPSYFSFFGGGKSQTQKVVSTGSGIIIGQTEKELLIVTNNHVIKDAEELTVCFIDEKAVAATVKGSDEGSDLAVVAVALGDIESATKEAIRIAKLGTSGELIVGKQVVAIGNALGYGQSVTTGIISAVNRKLSGCDAVMIQTDAAINPGNSGGALLNMNCEVIGINSAKFSSTEVEGMGYAIDVNKALSLIQDLMNAKTRTKVSADKASWIGIKGATSDSASEAAYGIPQGVYISEIVKDGPCDKAGIPEKSVITSFDGKKISTIDQLVKLLEYYEAGETVKITAKVLEGKSYTEKTFTVTLGRAADNK